MKISVHSNIGKRRTSNQDYADYYTSKTKQNLFILCDGVGGHQAGDVASRMTTNYLGEKFESIDTVFTLESIQTWMLEAIQDVNQFIYKKSVEYAELVGMGTTLVMAAVVDGQFVIAHVGDSRAYAYYQDDLRQITEDHSLVNELIRSGEITEEEANHHPRRNVVTQSIGGTDTVSAELNTVSISEVDILLLCSDGLTNMVSREELVTLFNQHRFEENFGELLITAANDAGGMDNITLILVSQDPTSADGGEQ